MRGHCGVWGGGGEFCLPALVCVCETAGRRLLEKSQGTSATGTSTEEFILALDREPFIPGRTK